MVAVKDGNEVALSDAHRVVNVAGLGVLVFFALDIAGADFTGKVFKFLTTAVVQDINIEFFFGPVYGERCVHRRFHYVQRFVVSRNENIDTRPALLILRQRGGFTVKHPADLEVAEQHHDEGIGFSDDQQPCKDHRGVAVGIQCFRITPPNVAGRHDDRNHDQHQQRKAGLRLKECKRDHT